MFKVHIMNNKNKVDTKKIYNIYIYFIIIIKLNLYFLNIRILILNSIGRYNIIEDIKFNYNK